MLEGYSVYQRKALKRAKFLTSLVCGDEYIVVDCCDEGEALELAEKADEYNRRLMFFDKENGIFVVV